MKSNEKNGDEPTQKYWKNYQSKSHETYPTHILWTLGQLEEYSLFQLSRRFFEEDLPEIYMDPLLKDPTLPSIFPLHLARFGNSYIRRDLGNRPAKTKYVMNINFYVVAYCVTTFPNRLIKWLFIYHCCGIFCRLVL